jgi:hypothetical protein
MMRVVFHLCLSVFICGFIFGCRRDRVAAESKAYFGPTQTLAEIVAEVNRNSEALPTLWASGDFEARVVDEGKRRFVNGDVTLLYRRPDEVRLVGKKDIAGVVFDAVSTPERYWLIVKGETDTMWHGSVDYLDRIDPKQIPIRPDVLVEILAVERIDPNLLQPPVPTMRFNNDADAYMLTFNVRLADRWAVRKEVWYDRQTKLPRMVLLFDEHGRIVVRAYLSNHRAVETEAAQGQRPRVATRYQVFFPDTGTTMRIDLEDLALSRNRAPSNGTFAFPTNPGVSRQINLDEQARP